VRLIVTGNTITNVVALRSRRSIDRLWCIDDDYDGLRAQSDCGRRRREIDGNRRIGVSQEHNSSKRVRPFLHDVLCERRSVVVNQHAPHAHPITHRFSRRGDARVEGLAARATV
jgi:hypothetical protein